MKPIHPTALLAGLLPVFAAIAGCLGGDRLLATAVTGNGGAIGGDGAVAGAGGGLGGGGAAPFSAPVLILGIRGDADDVQDPTLPADETEIFFSSPTAGSNDIWTSRRASPTAPWTTSVLVSELSSATNDESPELSGDGLSIYLASDRAGAGMRLYFSQRADRFQPWAPPQAVTGLGPSSGDTAPASDAARLTLVFASQRATETDLHLYLAARGDPTAAWGVAVKLSAIDSAWQDRDPALFAGGRGLVFASRRTGAGRTADLFQTTRADPGDAFMVAPVPLIELNTELAEGDPWLSPDGRHIVFMSDRDGPSRLYESWR
jgi:Tol biopolymer transport system component